MFVFSFFFLFKRINIRYSFIQRSSNGSALCNYLRFKLFSVFILNCWGFSHFNEQAFRLRLITVITRRLLNDDRASVCLHVLQLSNVIYHCYHVLFYLYHYTRLVRSLDSCQCCLERLELGLLNRLNVCSTTLHQSLCYLNRVSSKYIRCLNKNAK